MKSFFLLIMLSFFTTLSFAQNNQTAQELFDQGAKYCNNGQYADAVSLFRKVAEQGVAEAQYNLAICYYEEKDYNQAVYWYRKAAKQGNASAIKALKELGE